MRRGLQFNPKCIFEIDHEGWLSIRDGYAEIGLAPDEVEALQKFLAEGTAKPSKKSEPYRNCNDMTGGI